MHKTETVASGQAAVAVGNDNHGAIITGPVIFEHGGGGNKSWESPCFLLPPEVPDFTGRDREIEAVEDKISLGESILITGKPGVGKTSLALHIAYKARDAYQDGALYADLRGIEKDPASPQEIMRRFLCGVGVPEEDVPSDADSRVDRYRREFANRRVTIILDNAGAESQIRTLIPPGGEALVLITSRIQLNGLEAARPLLLDVFDEDSSLAFLRRIVGGEIVDKDPVSARTVGNLCGHLPLALRIAGNRLRYVSMADLAEELRDQRNRLEALEVGDLAVRAAFNLSFRNLGKSARNALKRVSCVPGEDFGAALCAALNDSDDRHASISLRRLSENNLIDYSARPNRYRFHDLIKVFAKEKFESDSDRKKDAAVRRMLNWLSYSALKANLTLCGGVGRVEFPSIHIADIKSVEMAAAWLDSEALNAAAAIEMLAQIHEEDQAKSLAIQLSLASEIVGNWRAWEDAIGHGLRVVESYPDPLVEVALLGSKVNLLRYRREFKPALDLAAKIYPKAISTQNKMLMANAAKLLGCLKMDVGEFSGALPLLEESLSLNRELGLKQEVGKALYNIGTVHRASGRTHEAIWHFEEDLKICLESNDVSGAAETMNTLALTYMEVGEFSKSEDYQRESLRIFQSIGNVHKVSMVCNDLALSLRHEEKFEEALALHLDDIERCNTYGNISGGALAKANAAVLLVELDRDSEAEPLFEEAVSVFMALGDELRLARTLVGQIQMLFKAGHVALAVEGFNKAIEILIQYGEVRDAISAHQGMVDEFMKISDYDRALFHAEESLRLGKGIVAPYLNAACCISAILACEKMDNADSAAKFETKLREIVENYPDLDKYLRERVD